jgi:hypothetical protein
MPRKKVLGKKKGVSKKKTYSKQDKKKACIMYWTKGTVKGAAKELGMPRETLRTWMGQEWWADITLEVRDAVEDQLEVDLVEVLTLSMDRIKDSLTEGDEKLVWNPVLKEHVKERVMPTGIQASTMMGISYDKRRIGQNMPTSITEQSGGKQMQQLMENFQKLAQENAQIKVKKINSIEGELDE